MSTSQAAAAPVARSFARAQPTTPAVACVRERLSLRRKGLIDEVFLACFGVARFFAPAGEQRCAPNPSPNRSAFCFCSTKDYARAPRERKMSDAAVDSAGEGPARLFATRLNKIIYRKFGENKASSM